MNSLIATDVRVYKNDNRYYTDNGFFRILERYSKKFENLTLLTRIFEKNEIPENSCEITNLCINFEGINSLKDALIGKHNKKIYNLVKNSDFIIVRVPSIIPFCVSKYAIKQKKIYMAEIMGCAWDAYWNHSIIGKLLAPYVFLKMKRIVYNAKYATYVTQRFLQNRYPCKNANIGVSNVCIKNIEKVKKYNKTKKNEMTFLTAAAVNVKYKGQKFMIKAMKKLKKQNIHIKYFLAGKGDNKYLKKLAKKYKLSNNVIFLGELKHDELLEQMKKIDVYIQPSLQEGLPRSLIEAMSCGCVCLGSTTAGIPELLDSKYIFKRGKVKPIVNAVKNILTEDWEKISKENIKKSEEYLEDKLNKKRFDYYDKIIEDLEHIETEENK